MSKREPTSTPCVGSSARMTLTLPRRNGRVSETFCWLPPESDCTGCSIEAARMRSRRPSSSTACRSRPRRRSPNRPRRRRIWIVAFARTLSTGKSASPARSPLSRTTPARSGPSGDARSRSLPSHVARPAAGSAPASARRNCSCPFPSAPAMPTISPAATDRSIGPKRSPCSPSAASTTSLADGACRAARGTRAGAGGRS